MNKTTGAEATALSIACLVESERRRRCRAESANDGEAVGIAASRAAGRTSCCGGLLAINGKNHDNMAVWTYPREDRSCKHSGLVTLEAAVVVTEGSGGNGKRSKWYISDVFFFSLGGDGASQLFQ